MAASINRATKISQLHTALKKFYKPVPQPELKLMELLLYSCLLEDAPYEAADECLAKLQHDYFDWNEVRVTTVTELCDVLRSLPNPSNAAMRLKKNLQSLFETFYAFDLEELKKLNVGKAVEALEKMPSTTPFVLAYVVQNALDGHMIPIDRGATQLLLLCDVVTIGEVEKGKTPGLERAIAKAKGSEFASLLHQAAATLIAHPKDKNLWTLIKSMNPNASPALLEKQNAATAAARKASKAESDAKAQQEALEKLPPKGGPSSHGKPIPATPPVVAKDLSSKKGVPTKELAKPAVIKPVATDISPKPTAPAKAPEPTKKAAEAIEPIKKKVDSHPTSKTPEPAKPDPRKPDLKKPELKKQDQKPELKKSDLKKPEPKKPELKKPEPKKVDLKKPELKKPEPKKPDTKKPDLKKPDLKKHEPTKASSKQLTRRKPK